MKDWWIVERLCPDCSRLVTNKGGMLKSNAKVVCDVRIGDGEQ